MDSQDEIERLVATDIYSRFVRHQMSMSASKALAGDRGRYAGLGDCFVLTDPAKADNPIVYASDGFVKVTGYTRNEIIPRKLPLPADPTHRRIGSETATASDLGSRRVGRTTAQQQEVRRTVLELAVYSASLRLCRQCGIFPWRSDKLLHHHSQCDRCAQDPISDR